MLSQASLETGSFTLVTSRATSGDIVYLDPPYPPLDATSFFTHYTKERFDDLAQLEVAKVAQELSDRGCNVVISNADTPSIRQMYPGWRKRRVPVSRVITCKKRVREVYELIITNR